MFKTKRILFWLAGDVPTREERLSALRFGPGVSFRNALHVPSVGALEDCDGVTALDAATIPPRYAAKFPVVMTIEDLTELYRRDYPGQDGDTAAEVVGALAKAGEAAAAAERTKPAPKPAKPFAATPPAAPVAQTGPAMPVEWKPNT